LLYDYPQAAWRLNVKQSWLETHVQNGSLPHTRLGRLVRFSQSDLDEIIALNRLGAITQRRRR